MLTHNNTKRPPPTKLDVQKKMKKNNNTHRPMAYSKVDFIAICDTFAHFHEHFFRNNFVCCPFSFWFFALLVFNLLFYVASKQDSLICFPCGCWINANNEQNRHVAWLIIWNRRHCINIEIWGRKKYWNRLVKDLCSLISGSAPTFVCMCQIYSLKMGALNEIQYTKNQQEVLTSSKGKVCFERSNQFFRRSYIHTAMVYCSSVDWMFY